MAIKLPSNLHRNRFGILYFRITIPKDIQIYFATKVIYRSLHTSSLRHASDTVRQMAINTKYLFKELRNQDMSEPKKTSLEVWNDFKNLPDIRERLKLAGLQVTADEQAKELEQREQLISNLDVQQTQTIDRHEKALQALDKQRINDLSLSLRALASAGLSKPETSSGQVLSSYISEYIANINANREKNDWINEQGIEGHRHTCQLLIEIIGDKPLACRR